MSVSDIAVTALTAVATVKGNQLTITTLDPRSGALPNIALDHVDIYASQTDTFASASVVTQGTLRALHANAGEEQTWYYWGIPYDKLGAAGTRYPSGATGGVACTSLGQVGLAFGLSNGKITSSVSANAITYAIKTAAGNDPSASDPVYVAFPNSTLTTGNYQVRAITAAISITVPSGSSLGNTNANTPFRTWLVLFDDAGTLRMGVKNCSDGTGTVYPLADFALASSTIVTTGGGASSLDTFYTPTAVSSKPFRIIGYADWNSGLASPTLWSAGPDVLRMVGGGLKPGIVVEEVAANLASTVSTATVIPFDDTIPQNTEGASLITVALTPASPVSVYDFEVVLNVSHTVASEVIVAVFKDSGANAIAAGWSYVSAADKLAVIVLRFRVQAGSSANRTYDFRYGGSQVGTIRLNGSAGARKLGGVANSFIRLVEIMG